MINEILKKFDKEFGNQALGYGDDASRINRKNIKSFISSSLKALLESLVKDLEGEKKKLPDEINLEDNPELASKSLQGLGFNSALNLAIEKIRKLV